MTSSIQQNTNYLVSTTWHPSASRKLLQKGYLLDHVCVRVHDSG